MEDLRQTAEDIDCTYFLVGMVLNAVLIYYRSTLYIQIFLAKRQKVLQNDRRIGLHAFEDDSYRN
jgi:hypothetical protein